MSYGHFKNVIRTPSKCHIFENIIEIGTFVPFSITFSKANKYSIFFYLEFIIFVEALKVLSLQQKII